MIMSGCYKILVQEYDEYVPEGIRLSTESRISLQTTFDRDVAMVKEQDKRKKEMKEKMKETETYRHKNTVRLLPLSTEIMESLVDQFQTISHRPMLWIKLPKPPKLTIKGLCSQFVSIQQAKIEGENNTNPKQEILYLNQTMASIQFYFNSYLEISILFETERIQKKILERGLMNMRRDSSNMKRLKQMDWCNVYGAEHLFRLYHCLEVIYNNIKQWDSPMQPVKISNYVNLFQGFLTKEFRKISVNFDINENKEGVGLVEQRTAV